MLRFRESFRGYNRDDVNAYIEQINSNFSKKEAELRAVITDLQVKAADNVSDKDNIGDESICSVRQELERSKLEIERLMAELNEFKNKSNGDCEEKSKLYDSMSAQVGSIIIQANSNAETIVSNAKAVADRMLADSMVRSNKILDEAESIKSEATRFAENYMAQISDVCIEEYDSMLSELNFRLNELAYSIKNRSEAILNSFNEKIEKLDIDNN